MENLTTLRLSVESMPVTQLFGFVLSVLEKGRSEVILPYRNEVSYRKDAFPATILGALADVSAGLACMTLLDDGSISSTVGFTISVLAPALGDRLIGRGRVVQAGKTLSVGAADIFAARGDTEVLCATALVTMRNPPPRP